MGGSFSYTFTQVGTNDYVCTPHAGNMFGTITVVADGTLSTESYNVFESIRMYPNPTESEINFSFDTQNEDNLDVKIYNLLGKEVISQKVSQKDASIVVANLNKGIYIVRISSNNADVFTTKRFVKL
jgi:protease II